MTTFEHIAVAADEVAAEVSGTTWEDRLKAERQAERDWFEHTSALIGQVGLALGWQVKTYGQEDRERLPDLADTDGRRLCFGKSRGPSAQANDKLHITGGWPTMETTRDRKQVTAYDVGEKYPSIEVSRSRDVRIIAREIARRLLPEYTRIYRRCVEQINASLNYAAKTESCCRDLCGALGLRPAEGPTVHLPYSNGDFYGTLTPNGDTVDIELRNVARVKALVLCGVLKGLKDMLAEVQA